MSAKSSKFITLLSITIFFSLILSIPHSTDVFAAKKIDENKGKNTLTGITGVCGKTGLISGHVNFHVIKWDNGNFNSHFMMKGVVTDLSTGEKIGSYHRTEHQQGTVSDLPLTRQITNTITCEGIGIQQNFNLGCTVHKDLSITCHGGIIVF